MSFSRTPPIPASQNQHLQQLLPQLRLLSDPSQPPLAATCETRLSRQGRQTTPAPSRPGYVGLLQARRRGAGGRIGIGVGLALVPIARAPLADSHSAALGWRLDIKEGLTSSSLGRTGGAVAVKRRACHLSALRIDLYERRQRRSSRRWKKV